MIGKLRSGFIQRGEMMINVGKVDEIQEVDEMGYLPRLFSLHVLAHKPSGKVDEIKELEREHFRRKNNSPNVSLSSKVGVSAA